MDHDWSVGSDPSMNSSVILMLRVVLTAVGVKPQTPTIQILSVDSTTVWIESSLIVCDDTKL